MIRIRRAATLLVLAAAAPALAEQDRSATNSVFLEGGGPGLAYSLNYERIFENDFGLRVGFSYLSVSGTVSSGSSTASGSVSMWTVPVLANYLGLKWGNHALELGGGATVVGLSGAGNIGAFAGSGSGTLVLGTAILGYRRQPPGGGFQFRIGLEALVGKGLALSESDRNPDKVGVLPWMYMSLGFSI
ncbi:MAG: hypothetical protein ACJ79H_08675 [Myxococcales bacterium]